MERTVRELGKLDILVSNAAHQNRKKSLEDITDEECDRTFKTNIYAYFWLAKAALPHLKPGSAIIATSSETGLRGNKGCPDYSATKGAINAFTKSLAQKLVDKGIRVNAVAPGPVWTPLNPPTRESTRRRSPSSARRRRWAGRPSRRRSPPLTSSSPATPTAATSPARSSAADGRQDDGGVSGRPVRLSPPGRGRYNTPRPVTRERAAMNLTPVELLAVGEAGLVTGLIGAVLGTGGGVFLVPVLVVGLGVPVHHAVATSIVTVIATSSAAASANVERRTANMRLGMALEVATALGAIAGGLTAAVVGPRALEGLFAAALVPTAVLMWRREPAADAGGPAPVDPGELGGTYLDPATGRPVTYRMHRLWAGLGVSLLAGNLSGLLGVGGGAFKVPALHLLCGVPIRAAAATSNFMIGVTAAASAFLYYGRGEVRPGMTAAAALGVLAGSAAGAAVSPQVRGGLVRKLFAGLLVAVAIQMLYRAARGADG